MQTAKGRKSKTIFGASLLLLSVAFSGCAGQTPAPGGPPDCKAFALEVPPQGSLYFAGESDWTRNQNHAKLSALNAAQGFLGAGLSSQVSKVCVESTKTKTKESQTHKDWEQKCQVASISQSIEVGALSSKVEYCEESKSQTVAGKASNIYKTRARIELSETAFDQAAQKALPPP